MAGRSPKPFLPLHFLNLVIHQQWTTEVSFGNGDAEPNGPTWQAPSSCILQKLVLCLGTFRVLGAVSHPRWRLIIAYYGNINHPWFFTSIYMYIDHSCDMWKNLYQEYISRYNYIDIHHCFLHLQKHRLLQSPTPPWSTSVAKNGFELTPHRFGRWLVLNLYYSWVFPKIMVPPNHPS